MKRILLVRQVTPRVLVGVARGRPGVRGFQGIPGVSMDTAYIDDNKHLILVLDDGSQHDTGELPSVGEIAQLQSDTQALQQAMARHVVVGQGAPQLAPQALLAHYLDTTGGQLYISRGTGGPSDWVKITGLAIASLQINASQHLIAHFTDGSSADLGLVKGEPGVDGVGVSGVTVDGQGRLQVTLTNGSTVDAGAIPVQNGNDGRGVASVSINPGKHLIVTFTDNTTQDAGQLPSSDEVAALQQQVNDLLIRVAALESADPIPNNALTGANGAYLTGPNGEYLTFGVPQ